MAITYINDIITTIQSEIRLFEGDILIYKATKQGRSQDYFEGGSDLKWPECLIYIYIFMIVKLTNLSIKTMSLDY